VWTKWLFDGVLFSVVVACGWLVRDFDYLIAFKSVEIYRIHGL
jgi:hypothetical protein